MKSVETTKTGKNFTAVSVGKLSEMKDYLLQLGDIQIPGKVFVGQALGTTGSELSFQTFAPGEGLYQVDGENIPVGEGSIIRVAPEGKRAIKNTGSEEMLMLCVQYKSNTFTAEDATDGVILSEELKW